MSPPLPRAGRREWIGVAALALPCMLVVMDLSVLFLAVPSLTADLHPSSTELSLILSTMSLLFAMCPHEDDRMKAIGLISAGFTSGAALGPILGGVLLDVET